ncbi:hypothetical protein PVAP13_6KG151400 [Panicum virgatum]|uniref:Reticulon-like protein n=1 Tax=Panicum virgatum TaxID=38727 RepID=A0A8T0RCP5_PANVG|nr:hypothetical protein PVAP13_6KG151400 [Panicum virgatum]
MQQQGSGGGTASSTTTSGGRRRVSVRGAAAAAPAGSASVWEARMRMDEVKGGVKVFSAGGGDEPADQEGMRVYRRLRRNQSDGNAGAGNGAAAAKKRRNWKASEPVTAIGDLRKSRSDAAAAVNTTTTAAVVARRAVARVTTPEKKIAPASGEVKEVVVVEVYKAQAEEPEEELDDDVGGLDDEELEAEEEEKEMLDQDHMAIDNDETALHQDCSPVAVDDDDDQDLEPPTKGIKSTLSVEDERAANPEPMKPPPEKKALPAIGRRIPKQEPLSTPPVEEYEEIQGRPSQPSRSHERMQNIVNLVMWRDVSKSALVFGLGTFLLISSSYAKDLNFNTITAASYAGLIYLGLRFLRKSILNRGETVDCDDERRSERCYLLGEEEAIWLLRLVLPYINEVLLNLRSLFSGEPATTMKLALLLFAMARCGNFVTLWTLAKLVFFGVFIIPKVCSSYSTQLARYGKFWLERLRDAWESCSHKKAVVAAMFTLVWNVSSTVARVWAVFMLVVAMKLYQQRMVDFGWSSTVEDGGAGADEGEADDEAHSEEPAAKPSPSRAQCEAQVFGMPRHRRAPVSGEFARERLRVRGGIQPR